MSKNIPEGWKKVRLGKVVEINPSETLKKGTLAKKVPMEALQPFNKKIHFFNFERYKGGVKFRNGDTLVARITPSLENGKTAFVDILENEEIGFGSTEFIVLRAINEITDSQFLYYFAISPDFRDIAIKSMTGSSGRQRVQTEVVKEFEFYLPPLSEQKAIAAVLSSLDDKIDLLHRQNKTLEAMAETLFRKWFIEETKEDWEEVKLEDVVDIGIGRTPPRKEFHWFSKSPNDIKWVSVKDLGENGVFIFNTSEYLTESAINNFNIPVIPENTVLLSFKMTVGRLGITTEPMVSNEAIAHFKFKEETPFTTEYLYFFLKTFPYQELGSTSSIVTSINSKMIKELIIPIPETKIMNDFKRNTKNLFDKIKQNQQQIRILENLRDTLLPKLMSGEVRVKY